VPHRDLVQEARADVVVADDVVVPEIGKASSFLELVRASSPLAIKVQPG
jgi:hypothetical protein